VDVGSSDDDVWLRNDMQASPQAATPGDHQIFDQETLQIPSKESTVSPYCIRYKNVTKTELHNKKK
jgi:hypothetical protein